MSKSKSTEKPTTTPKHPDLDSLHQPKEDIVKGNVPKLENPPPPPKEKK